MQEKKINPKNIIFKDQHVISMGIELNYVIVKYNRDSFDTF